jgi:hypothetical protein
MKNITITELDELSIRKYHEQGIQTMFFYKDDYRYIYQLKMNEDSNDDLVYFYACFGIPDYIVLHSIIDDQLCSMRITKKSLTFYVNGCPTAKAKNDCTSIYSNFKAIEKAFENIDIKDVIKVRGNKPMKDNFRLFF